MQTSKPINWLSLSTITFSISLFLGLWGYRDFGKAFLTGMITIPASIVGVSITNKRRRQQDQRLRYFLRRQIQDLQIQQEQLHQEVLDKINTKQTLEANIQALKSEHNQAIRLVSDLYYQRNELYQEVNSFYHHQQEQETKTEQYEKRQSELRQVLSAKTVEIQKAKTELSGLQSELNNLQVLITGNQRQKEQVNQEILEITQRKQELESQEQSLDTSIESLTEKQHRILQEIADLKIRKQELETTGISENNAQTLSPEEWEEWLGFIRQLSEDEKLVMLAILEQDRASLKEIADRNTTMPGMLIDRVNENSLKTLGDTLLIPEDNGGLPEINEEYTLIFTQPIQVYLRDLLFAQIE